MRTKGFGRDVGSSPTDDLYQVVCDLFPCSVLGWCHFHPFCESLDFGFEPGFGEIALDLGAAIPRLGGIVALDVLDKVPVHAHVVQDILVGRSNSTGCHVLLLLGANNGMASADDLEEALVVLTLVLWNWGRRMFVFGKEIGAFPVFGGIDLAVALSARTLSFIPFSQGFQPLDRKLVGMAQGCVGVDLT